MPNGRRTNRRRTTRRRPNGYGMGSTSRRGRMVNNRRSRRSYRSSRRATRGSSTANAGYKVVAMDKEAYMLCPPNTIGITDQCRAMSESERHAYINDPNNPQVFNMK